MEQEARQGQALTPNQIVAFNLKRLRGERGLTQERAAQVLEPYLGARWSSAQFSVAERWNPKPGQKARQFGADELVAFAAAFGVPVGYFLRAPDPTRRVLLPGPKTLEADGEYMALYADRAYTARERAEVKRWLTEAERRIRRIADEARQAGIDVTAEVAELEEES